MHQNQTVKILLIFCRMAVEGFWRKCEGDTPKARRNEAEKWLWLAKPSAKLSSVREVSLAATGSKDARSRIWLR